MAANVSLRGPSPILFSSNMKLRQAVATSCVSPFPAVGMLIALERRANQTVSRFIGSPI